MGILFSADWDGDLELYAVGGDGSEVTQLTDNDVDDYSASWSSDGARLAYISDSFDPRLHLMNADGSGRRLIAEDLVPARGTVAWSPLGDTIAFRYIRDLYAVQVESGDTTLLVRDDDLFPDAPVFSPDGSRIAFIADVEGSAWIRLYTVNADGTGLAELDFEDGDVYFLSWHPELEQIVFSAYQPAKGPLIYTIDPDGELTVVSRPGASGRPLWAPDGSVVGYFERILGLDEDGEPNIDKDFLLIATADGGVELAVLKPPDEPLVGLALSDFVWAPDSRHLAYTTPTAADDSETVDLHVLDVCSGASKLVAEGIDKDSTPSWTAERISFVVQSPTEQPAAEQPTTEQPA
ncbi:MAG: TolB family protein, partial [Anaerolineales bacterium]